MKTRILSILIALLMLVPVAAQQASQADLLEAIRQESFDLAVIEEEVAYYEKLVEKRQQIKKLQEQGRTTAVREMFERDLAELEVIFEADDTERALDKVWEIKKVYRGIEEMEISNYFPERRLQYYEARMDVMEGRYREAQRVLEKLLADNLDAQNRNKIVYLLEEIYFNLENYSDFVSVYPLYRGLNSVKQRWWLGHSLYNTGKFNEASTVFKRLSADEHYGLRARCMGVLITYSLGDTEKAISDYLTLKYRYEPSDPYYNFINLSLARLYALEGQTEEAINLYDQYMQLEEAVSDDILYEIATIYKQFGEYSQAIRYYKMITQKPKKSRYYVSAKYFTAITEQDRGNYESGREHLQEIIETNDALMLALNEKYGLLENYAGLLRELTSETLSNDRQEEISGELIRLEEAFVENRRRIEEYSEGLDSEKLLYLKLLEEEYFAYTITLANYEAFVRYSRNPLLKRLPSVKNYQMSHTDSSVVYLQMVDYVEKLTNQTSEQYRLARFMAEQRVYQAYVRDVWFDIMHVGLDYNVAEIIEVADRADSLISSSLDEILQVEEWAFSGELDGEEKSQVREFEDKIKENNKELEKAEEEFIGKFSEHVTPLLAAKVDDFAFSQDDIRTSYVETITLMVETLSNENRMYENTLLDILFRQTRMFDEEYIEFREELTNENKY